MAHDVQLTPVEVRVLDAAGRPLEGLELNVERQHAPLQRPLLMAPREVWTDPQGWARTRIRLGRGRAAVLLTLIRDGHGRTYRVPVLGGRVQKTLRWGALASRQVTLSVPSGFPGETLRLTPLGGTASEVEALLDAARQAVFPSVRPGSYRARLGERAFAGEVLIPAGSGPIRLTLPGRGAASTP